MYNYKTPPFEHQRHALTQGAKERNFAYFMEMGTGKTKVAIDNACFLFQSQLIQYCIVIAPNSVYQNWKKENVLNPSTKVQYIPVPRLYQEGFRLRTKIVPRNR